MRVFITVAVAPPTGTAALDALQCQGAAALMADVVSRAVEAVGPDGAVIRMVDSQVNAHPHGAVIATLTESPTAPAAVQAITGLVEHALTTSPALTGWQVTETTNEQLPTAVGATLRPARRPRTRRGRP